MTPSPICAYIIRTSYISDRAYVASTGQEREISLVNQLGPRGLYVLPRVAGGTAQMENSGYGCGFRRDAEITRWPHAMTLSYIDPITGDRRLKRRFWWAVRGFAAGLIVGTLVVQLLF
jgi:hypothetical protein